MAAGLSDIQEWMKGKGGWVVVMVLAAGLIGWGAVAGYRYSADAPADAIRRRGKSVTYLCKACGASGRTHADFNVKFPVVCPRCRKAEAVAAFKCYGCGKVIEAVSAPYFRCPHCRYEYDMRLPGAPGGAAEGGR